jgi:hypothetical protein
VQAFKNKVARLSKFVRISFLASGENTVDAAIAQVLPGDVTPTILNIGNISSAVVGPRWGWRCRRWVAQVALRKAPLLRWASTLRWTIPRQI